MKNTFQIQVLNAKASHYCDEQSADGVRIWGPVTVRNNVVVLVELRKSVPSAVLAPFIAQSLSRCEITHVQLFDDRIPFTVEQLQKVLNKQSQLGN
jgi:hypothetical protein